MDVDGTPPEAEAEDLAAWVLPRPWPHVDPPALTAWPCPEEDEPRTDEPPGRPPREHG